MRELSTSGPGDTGMARRDFVTSGIVILAAGMAGLGGTGALVGCTQVALSDKSAVVADEAAEAGHWGLVIDVAKLNAEGNFGRIKAACHQKHNVPLIHDAKTEVKWIWAESFEHSFIDLENTYMNKSIKDLEFPMLCNHCENPVCVRVCPTQATFQRPDGIVDMDYHRCIGCRFCMTGCPFNARSLNFYDPRPYIGEVDPGYPTRTKGVVEKCNFCVERLKQGLAPYCVEESNGSFVFGDLDDPGSDVRKALETGFSIRRRVSLGTGPSVYYLVEGGEPDA
ncbi:MAG: 4Fe-4S dicluster domain-containing protein [Coriobacteriales bacterium]|jgi:molybdopterin-containing oxidoreductase family iron-sulfur binding subunit|nr:4Fe-4S dicluster domain-containing protein [Coriobacteriales bacterium]